MVLPGGRKFILTAGSLAGVFTLAFMGKDVSGLALIVPAILAFYGANNVAQDWVYKNSNQPLPANIIVTPPANNGL